VDGGQRAGVCRSVCALCVRVGAAHGSRALQQMFLNMKTMRVQLCIRFYHFLDYARVTLLHFRIVYYFSTRHSYQNVFIPKRAHSTLAVTLFDVASVSTELVFTVGNVSSSTSKNTRFYRRLFRLSLHTWC
jgi:hypothetical protein